MSKLHRTKSKTDTFTCDLKTPEMFECEFCGFESNLRVDLTEHVRVFHDGGKEENEELENIFKCHRCKNCHFETYSMLVFTKHDNQCISSKDHETMHDGNNLCHVDNYKWREFISTKGVKWYKCKQCSYRTTSNSCIATHIGLEKHDQVVNWFQCEDCAYKTKDKGNLKKHIIGKHTSLDDQSRYQCEDCMYRTNYKSNLKRHFIRKHRNLKNDQSFYQCEDCTYRTNYKSNLKKHIIGKHANSEDISWFQCEECAYKTKIKGNFKKHIIGKHASLEDEQSWYQCEDCMYKTNYKNNLKRHLKKHKK